MRFGMGWAALALALVGAPAAAQTFTVDENQLFEQLNAARADPQAYMHGLQQYRGLFHANLLRYPGVDSDIETQEGTAVVDETIAYLIRQPVLHTLTPSRMLQDAAREHLEDQERTGEEGHRGSDGSSPGVRVKRLGGDVYVAEVISYGSVDAVDAMRQLIVDDGVADRGHREIIFTAMLRYAGAACGPHPRYGTMCVIDLAITPDGRYPAPERKVQIASN